MLLLRLLLLVFMLLLLTQQVVTGPAASWLIQPTPASLQPALGTAEEALGCVGVHAACQFLEGMAAT
jgi:hypothetical protein